MLGEMVIFNNEDNQRKDLRPNRIERDKKDKGTKLKVWKEIFSSTWKYYFLNDDLASISTETIPSTDITGYQKDKAGYIQYIEERLSQIKSNTFLNHYDVFILKHFSL